MRSKRQTNRQREVDDFEGAFGNVAATKSAGKLYGIVLWLVLDLVMQMYISDSFHV
jgi:hypothetical protein